MYRQYRTTMTIVDVLKDISRKVINHFLSESESFKSAIRHLVLCEIVIHVSLKFVILNRNRGQNYIILFYNEENGIRVGARFSKN